MSADVLDALRSGSGGDPGSTSILASAGPATPQSPAIPDVLSILPLRSFVVFPGTVTPLNVQRPASIKLLDETLPQSKIIGLISQRDSNKEDPQPQDLYEVGTAAIILKLLRQADDHVIALVQGLRRFSLRKIVSTHPYVRAEIAVLDSIPPPQTNEFEATFRNLRDSAAQLMELTPDVPDQVPLAIRSIDQADQLTDFLAPNLNIDVAQKQSLLEELDVEKRVRAVQTHISGQLEIAQIQQKLHKDVQSQFSDAQRKAYLRSQLKAIQ
jgi:ATP-dependent Lon protease